MALITNFFEKIKKNRLEANEICDSISEYISFCWMNYFRLWRSDIWNTVLKQI